MSQPPKPNSSAKQEISTSTSTEPLYRSQDPSLIQELKEACLNAAEHYVALHVPHGRLLSLLLDFVARHGLSVVDRWSEDDLDSDVEWEPEDE